jgi:hypothetical protein
MLFPMKVLDSPDRAGTFVAGHSTGSFSTEGSAGLKTAYIVGGAHTYKTTDTYGDGICY